MDVPDYCLRKFRNFIKKFPVLFAKDVPFCGKTAYSIYIWRFFVSRNAKHASIHVRYAAKVTNEDATIIRGRNKKSSSSPNTADRQRRDVVIFRYKLVSLNLDYPKNDINKYIRNYRMTAGK